MSVCSQTPKSRPLVAPAALAPKMLVGAVPSSVLLRCAGYTQCLCSPTGKRATLGGNPPLLHGSDGEWGEPDGVYQSLIFCQKVKEGAQLEKENGEGNTPRTEKGEEEGRGVCAQAHV